MAIIYNGSNIVPAANWRSKSGISKIYVGGEQIVGRGIVARFDSNNTNIGGAPSNFTMKLFAVTSIDLNTESFEYSCNNSYVQLESETFFTGNFSVSVQLWDDNYLEFAFNVSNSRYAISYNMINAYGPAIQGSAGSTFGGFLSETHFNNLVSIESVYGSDRTFAISNYVL